MFSHIPKKVLGLRTRLAWFLEGHFLAPEKFRVCVHVCFVVGLATQMLGLATTFMVSLGEYVHTHFVLVRAAGTSMTGASPPATFGPHVFEQHHNSRRLGEEGHQQPRMNRLRRVVCSVFAPETDPFSGNPPHGCDAILAGFGRVFASGIGLRTRDVLDAMFLPQCG